MNLMLILMVQFIFGAFADDIETTLINDYKIKKQSSLKICKQKPFRYVRFYKIEGNIFERIPDRYVTKIDNDFKNTESYDPKEDVDGFPPYVIQAQDINEDGLTDLLVSYGMCGSSADCMYDILVHCGQGKYKSLLEEEGTYLNTPEFVPQRNKVDGAAWNQLKVITRYRNVLVGCDAAIGDFPVYSYLHFNGKEYTSTQQEKKRIKKEFKKNFDRIEKECGKKFDF